MMRLRSSSAFRRAFILLETMLAVIVFSMAVLALGKCMDNCLRAEMLKEEDTRARRCLENRMAEVEAGAVPIDKNVTEQLKDDYAGMTLRQTRTEIKRKNEKNQEIQGLALITLDLSWTNRGEVQTSTLKFYVYPKPS